MFIAAVYFKMSHSKVIKQYGSLSKVFIHYWTHSYGSYIAFLSIETLHIAPLMLWQITMKNNINGSVGGPEYELLSSRFS